MFQHIARFSPFGLFFWSYSTLLFILTVKPGAFYISAKRKAATAECYSAVPSTRVEGFVHLKSLIVRPAVLRGLAPLKRSLTHRNWAGLTDYTCPFGFAISYVFDKQSGSPCHCDLLMLLINQEHL
jgi:hypothetical protein